MSAIARTGERHRSLSTEAGMGQMLRGGRSWPSDWKVGAGAAKCGKTVVPRSVGVRTDGATAISGAAEQDDRQWRPLSKPLWLWSCGVWSSPVALAMSCPPWSWLTTSVCEAGCCSHSSAAADTPRRGRSIASSTRRNRRTVFTGLSVARGGYTSLSRKRGLCNDRYGVEVDGLNC